MLKCITTENRHNNVVWIHKQCHISMNLPKVMMNFILSLILMFCSICLPYWATQVTWYQIVIVKIIVVTVKKSEYFCSMQIFICQTLHLPKVQNTTEHTKCNAVSHNALCLIWTCIPRFKKRIGFVKPTLKFVYKFFI